MLMLIKADKINAELIERIYKYNNKIRRKL